MATPITDGPPSPSARNVRERLADGADRVSRPAAACSQRDSTRPVGVDRDGANSGVREIDARGHRDSDIPNSGNTCTLLPSSGSGTSVPPPSPP